MRVSTLYTIFRKSPIGALQCHVEAIKDCVNGLPEVFRTLLEDDSDLLSQEIRKMADFEQLADTLKDKLRIHQPCGIMMPMDRTDLLNLVTQQRSSCGQ